MARFFRACLFLANTLVIVLGVSLCGFSSAFLSNASPNAVRTDLFPKDVLYGFLTLGIACLIVSAHGCFTGYKASRPHMVGFASLLLLIVAAQILLAFVTLSHSRSPLGPVAQIWNTASQAERAEFESFFGCCSLNGLADNLGNSSSPTSQHQPDEDLVAGSLAATSAASAASAESCSATGLPHCLPLMAHHWELLTRTVGLVILVLSLIPVSAVVIAAGLWINTAAKPKGDRVSIIGSIDTFDEAFVMQAAEHKRFEPGTGSNDDDR
ncbi:Tetraspanin/Peripherin [Entophlyctis helioformis]|nr:Tetraspanin/Peripherin [Entophlyctis helioformis]